MSDNAIFNEVHQETIFEEKMFFPAIYQIYKLVSWADCSELGDFQNKGKFGWTGMNFFVLKVPLRNLCPSIINSIQCDQILQRAYLG